MRRKGKKKHLWSCYLYCSLDFALILLDLAPWFVSSGPPGKFSGTGQCKSVSLPDPGKPNGSLQDRPPSSPVGGACTAQRLGFELLSPFPWDWALWGYPGSCQDDLNRLTLGMVSIAYRRSRLAFPLLPMLQLFLGHWHPLVSTPCRRDIKRKDRNKQKTQSHLALSSFTRPALTGRGFCHQPRCLRPSRCQIQMYGHRFLAQSYPTGGGRDVLTR